MKFFIRFSIPGNKVRSDVECASSTLTSLQRRKLLTWPRILLGMVEARSVNVKETTTAQKVSGSDNVFYLN